MQHGHYIHVRDSAYEDQAWMYRDKIVEEDDEDKAKTVTTEGPSSPRIAILPVWRARCITPYNPELLPPEAVPLREEASTESLIDKSEDDIWRKIERDLDYSEGDHEEYYQGEASSRIDLNE